MSGRAIDRRGVDSVLSGVELYPKAYYSVWEGKIPKFTGTDDDGIARVGLLENNLEAMVQSGTDALYTIRFHAKKDKDGYITDKTPVIGSFNFKVSEPPQLGYLAGVGAVAGRSDNGRLDALESKINAIIEGLAGDDESEPKQSEDEKMISGIGALLSNPMLQPIIQPIVAGVSGFITRIMQPSQYTPPVALAGIPDNSQDEKIESAVAVLRVHDDKLGDHLHLLANMAQKEPARFKMLLGMLSNM